MRSLPALIESPIRAFVSVTALLLSPLVSAQGLTFTDVTDSAGLVIPQSSIPTTELYERAVMTGGAAACDFDGDGWVDLVMTRIDLDPILYRNRGDGTFEDVTDRSGISMPAGSNGVAWGDVDNDGDPDLYITRADYTFEESGTHQLYLNQGGGVFSEAAVERGASLGPATDRFYGTGVAFGDYDRDGWLDLHVNEWGTAVRSDTPNSHTRLLQNLGNASPGFFRDTTDRAGVVMDDNVGWGPLWGDMDGAWAFSSRFADLNLDGFPDLMIAADFETSHLFLNNGDRTFRKPPITDIFLTDENGMGLTVGDYDNDGLPDIFVTAIYHDEPPHPDLGHNNRGNYGTGGNRLYRNLGDGAFVDATDQAGVRDGQWGWGASFLDYDNDGDLDLVMTNGFPKGDFEEDSSRLFENNGDGSFDEVSTALGIDDKSSGKGLLTFDYDRDGDLDIFLVNNSDLPVLYRNDGGNRNSWLRVKLEGTESNRDGVGARITVTGNRAVPAQTREVDAGSNYLSQNEIVAHFGLGDSSHADVRIDWPSGTVQIIPNVSVNQTLEVLEPGSGSSLRIVRSGQDVSLDWYSSWRLQRSIDLESWSDLPEATPPHDVPADGPRESFWRIVAPGLLLIDSFEEAASGDWAVSGPSWRVTEGKFEQTVEDGEQLAIAGSAEWSDYEICAEVSLLTGQEAGLQARYQPDGGCYQLVMSASSLKIERQVGGVWEELASVPMELDYGTAKHLTFRVIGRELVGYVNGVRKVSAHDDTFSGGRAALKTGQATARFDNISIRTL